MKRRRYMTKAWEPDGEWTYEEAREPGVITVFEPDRDPAWTGLYDAAGVRIMAVDEASPIGFFANLIED